MEKNTQLIQSLQQCIIACTYCAYSCLNEENVEAMTVCIKSDLDCAKVCSMTLDLLIRESDNSVQAVELCKDVCAECAEECGKHDHDHCRECAEACRRCVEHCDEYLNQ